MQNQATWAFIGQKPYKFRLVGLFIYLFNFSHFEVTPDPSSPVNLILTLCVYFKEQSVSKTAQSKLASKQELLRKQVTLISQLEYGAKEEYETIM